MSIPIKKGYADTCYGQVHFRYASPLAVQAPASGRADSSVTDTHVRHPLVFLHKSASSSACFESLMRHFAKAGHECIAPDLPGFGGSFDPDEEVVVKRDIEAEWTWDVDQKYPQDDAGGGGTAWYTRVLLAALQEAGMLPKNPSSNPPESNNRKCHILGHHSGAVLALELAARHPHLVASIALLGPTIMSAEERAAMSITYSGAFNRPRSDGNHLLLTWQYLGRMGVAPKTDTPFTTVDKEEAKSPLFHDEVALWHREALDHARAWRGRQLIYAAVWRQDSEALYAALRCPVLLLCARDDVLWEYMDFALSLRPDIAVAYEVEGGNFEPDRDAGGVGRRWAEFLHGLAIQV